MRERRSRVVVTFYTTAEAMAMERLCRTRAIDGKLISAPRELSADCGIAWSSPPAEEERIREALAETGLEFQGIHRMEI